MKISTTKSSCVEVHVVGVEHMQHHDLQEKLVFLHLEPPGWSHWRSGQFVMLRPNNWGEELTWGRPFSIYETCNDGLSVFFKVVGRGTQRLAELSAKDKVIVWGPLGNGFTVAPDTPTLLLAGGVGIAPFVSYVRQHPAPEHVKLFFGHRSPRECYPFDQFASIQRESFQDHGPSEIQELTDLLRSLMYEYKHQGLVLACGPLPFLRTAQRFALELCVRTQLSLENKMACGVGACLGCVSPDASGWPVQVCTEGPVFWADSITLEGA